MSSTKSNLRRNIAITALGTAFVLGGFALQKHLMGSKKGRSKRSAGQARGPQKPTFDPAQQFRVLERVNNFLHGEGPPSREELGKLFDDVAGEDGLISRSEFAVLVRAPLLSSVSGLIRDSVHSISALTKRPTLGAAIDEATLELALQIQHSIPKINAGIPDLSTLMFNALDVDGSGFLSKSEFQAAIDMLECFSDPAWVQGRPSPHNLAQMKPVFELLFRAADANGSGRLGLADTQQVLRSASNFAFDFASAVVNLVSDSINDSVLTKLVARPFKQALAELDADADGNIDIAELHLVPKVEQLVSQFRAAIPPLQRNGVEAGKLASFALEVLKRQVITDLVTGVAGVEAHLTWGDKAMAAVRHGVSESAFVRACIASSGDQHKESLSVVKTTLEAASAPSIVMKVLEKLHSKVVDHNVAKAHAFSLATAQQKLFSAVYSLCDVNDDGVISGQEVNAWGEIHKALNGDATADVEKCARAIFSLVDKNGDGEISQNEVEFFVRKLGTFSAAIGSATLEIAQVFVNAGINMLNDSDYQELLQQALSGNADMSDEEREAIRRIIAAESAAAIDPSVHSGDLKDQVALGGATESGLTADQAWAIMLHAWPGAAHVADADEDEAGAV